jgi:hypothetical protein
MPMLIPVLTTAFATLPKYGAHEARGALFVVGEVGEAGSCTTGSGWRNEGARELDGVGSGVATKDAEQDVVMDGAGVTRPP